ncbi:hypothetical protein BDP55DRAFT_686986 [Colletotrichum godetiae]|uniref:Uncharacterized protein n=1 Tax=Colletotrichum godetiae TaxID=1209918 RepID=A0AAJ0A9M2_9PEZI|nr:uncharacterized protein BDP55DRAFT_686986 [Colletotrichum godetiae]KAK1657040.1 hypothetical protein BDP55DRAFT_686986 [Colletotrichum godetiae]
MCQAWRYTFTCGHQSGEKWYDPENAEDCPEAVRANRRHRQYGTLLRCNPLSTASVSTQGVCSRDKCYAKEYLIPYGVKHCANSQAGLNQGLCRHNPCRHCQVDDPAQ